MAVSEGSSSSALPRPAIVKRRRPTKFLRYFRPGSVRLFARRLFSHSRIEAPWSDSPLPRVEDQWGNLRLVSVPDGVREFSYDDLNEFTDGFNPSNCFRGIRGKTANRSMVYRGMVPIDKEHNLFKDVIVETWIAADPSNSIWLTQIKLLMDPTINKHPNAVKLYGCCQEGEFLGLVYDCQAVGTVLTMIRDERFTWARRIKVALQVSRFLDHLHLQGIVVCTLEPATILLDQDFNAVVFGIGMASGGYLDYRAEVGHPCLICADEFSCPKYSLLAYVHPNCDAYSLGALLLTLVTKSEKTVEYIDPDESLIKELCDSGEFSLYNYTKCLVHHCFSGNEEYNLPHGADVTEIAVQCVVEQPTQRLPTYEVICRLEDLARNLKLQPSTVVC